MLVIQIKKLVKEAVLPTKAHPSDAGADLVATSKNVTSKYIEYGTGLSIELPRGYAGLIFPRSSVSNQDLDLANSVGLLDADFRGELKCRFRTVGYKPEAVYSVGDRIAQLVILPIPFTEYLEVSELGETVRGKGGFGSTNP